MCFFLMIRRRQRSTQSRSSAASDVYKRQDPDRLIKESGVDSFKQAIREALPYYEYKLQETLYKYGKIEEAQGYLTKKDEDNLLDEVVETASQIPDATDRDRYKKLFISLEAIKELGISEESLSITVDRLTSTRDKEAQAKEFKKLLSEATQLQDKGEIDKALDLLEGKLKEVRLKDKATEFSRLLIPTSEAKIKEEEANLPDSLNSGFNTVSYTHLRAHETVLDLVCRLLLEKKK